MLDPRVTSLTPAADPTHATVADCFDDTHWVEYKTTGGLAKNAPGGRRTTTAVLVHEGRRLEGDPDHHREDRHLLTASGRYELVGRFDALGELEVGIPPGDDVDVDVGGGRQSRDLPDGGTSSHQLLPPAAAARPDHDLGDVPLAGELDERLGRVVTVDLVPFGPDIGGEPVAGTPSSRPTPCGSTWRSRQ